MIVPSQSEFPLRVAVCAWCKPKKRGVDLGSALGSISHGICPRHYKKLQMELQMKDASQSPPAPAKRSHQRATTLNHPELNYPV